ncbi:glycosyltransferase family 2 protein [Gluconobacter thailandicus]|uniref:Glycosyltransferase family 2 protein n=1 Tax=Gluconobacter thailandicus TaxID=257438 RepID=A0AAP9EQN0_GLUTH|nr:glycosyltransferase family 2 protein [Gluconobacter thailandicus]QEH95799.1 glycosyltransferase family 2 protein [Gluconobacter thailandicus]
MTAFPTVAIALFVKNEFSDIAGWIAWHRALGVKTFFIFDDHSSDGTWEIIQSAAAVCDIRAMRTDPLAEPDFYLRQRNSFMAAAEMAKGHYDWIGFLDGDEYVYLKHQDNLPEFFSKFQDADAVALSWRIYGSSGRVVRPKITTVEAFTQHSTPDLGDNRLIKSFVRPEKLGSTYHNPHWYDIPVDRYVRADGRPVNGQDANQEIDWNDAFVMHYICRSMEHYIQRIKRRLNADLSDSAVYWQHFDRNDVGDREPLRLMPKVHDILHDIYRVMIGRAITSLRNTWDKIEGKNVVTVGVEKSPDVYQVKSHFGTTLYFLRQENRIVHSTQEIADQHDMLPVYGAIQEKTPNVITFFYVEDGEIGHRRSLPMQYDDRLAAELVYNLRAFDDNRFAAYNPVTNLHIVFIPNPNPGQSQGMELVAAERREVGEWEMFSLEKVESVSYPASLAPLPFTPGNNTTIDEILMWLVDAPVAPRVEEFLRVLASIPTSVREQIVQRVPGLLWTFV